MSEHMMPIPSRVYNAAVGGHVCGPEDLDFGQKVVHLIKYDRAGNEVSFESQVTQANKIYVIHDNFTLSSNVIIPANCVLKFDGGSISGEYTLTGNNTIIESENVTIFNGIHFSGTWNNKFIAEWLLPEYSSSRDYSDDLTYLFNCGIDNVVFTTSRIYNITRTIVVEHDIDIKSTFDVTRDPSDADDSRKVKIRSISNITVIEYRHTELYRKINIGGLMLVSGDENNPDYTTPILLLRLYVSIWSGGNINFDIKCNAKGVEYDGTSYVRHSMIGIEVRSEGGNGSFLYFGGRINVYKAFYFNRNGGSNWITDTHINCIIESNYGGTFTCGGPIYLGGSYQPRPLPLDSQQRTSEYFFNGSSSRVIASNAYVWDLYSPYDSDNLRNVKYAYENVFIGNQEAGNKNSIPNYPTEQSVMFPNYNNKSYGDISDFVSFDVECSKDNFSTILYGTNDIMNINGILNTTGYSTIYRDRADIQEMGAFISPKKVDTLDPDISTPLKVRYKIRYNNQHSHYLKILTTFAKQVNVTLKTYSDWFTTVYSEKVFDNDMSQGDSVTRRNTFVYIEYSYGARELIIEYEIPIYDALIYGKKTYRLIGFNIFDYASKEIYTNLASKYIVNNWIIDYSNRYSRTYIPTSYKNRCYHGFGLVVPSTDIGTDMFGSPIIVDFTYISMDSALNYDGGSDYGTARLTILKDGTAYVVGGHLPVIVNVTDYELADGLKLVNVYIQNYLFAINWIKATYLYLEGFVAGGSSDYTGGTRLIVNNKKDAGPTSDRPTSLLTDKNIGFIYFDTTLSKPIYWDGTQWVDATGTQL